MSGSVTWYEELRNRYRPQTLRVLLIGESPPDPGSGERRFFYSSRLSFDNLYRGVAEAVYGECADFDVRDKVRFLEHLRDDGFWLIDAVDEPIDKTSMGQRKAAIRAAAGDLAERCRTLAPECGVIICHGVVYELVSEPLRHAGVRILHDDSLPFPLGNWRARFIAGFREALLKCG
jgi:hypothetical protein